MSNFFSTFFLKKKLKFYVYFLFHLISVLTVSAREITYPHNTSELSGASFVVPIYYKHAIDGIQRTITQASSIVQTMIENTCPQGVEIYGIDYVRTVNDYGEKYLFNGRFKCMKTSSSLAMRAGWRDELSMLRDGHYDTNRKSFLITATHSWGCSELGFLLLSEFSHCQISTSNNDRKFKPVFNLTILRDNICEMMVESDFELKEEMLLNQIKDSACLNEIKNSNSAEFVFRASTEKGPSVREMIIPKM